MKLSQNTLSISDATQVPAWLEQLKAQSPNLALAVTISAEHYQQHWQQVPQAQAILATLELIRADAEAQAAALLWPVYEQAAEQVSAALHKHSSILALLQGHAEAKKVWPIYDAKTQSRGAEGIRRLLLVLIKDLRVVLILLAEQLVLLRSLAKHDEQERRRAAQVTADIHAPLANRLGIWQLKWELEDLSFRYLQPDVYRRIATLLDERRADRERYIKLLISELTRVCAEAGIKADVAGRPKHIWSIYKKMQRKGGDFAALYDVRAVRLLVADIPSCYAALGAVHAQYSPIPQEFDDYIANPKGNNYQSLHTAVIGPENKAVEIQIRTQQMHEHAELGVAAHWRYKEGGGSNAEFERKINWMRQLLEQRDDSGDDASLVQGFSTALLDDHVYVLTPKGEVIELANGGTVLDFAYLVHTNVGHRCRGAKVNGRIVPLTFQPKSGDQIEILTGKSIEPNRNWLDPSQGYLNTAKARGKVRAFFNQLDLAQNISAGREIVEKECKRLGLNEFPLEALAANLKIRKVDDFLIQLALGDLTLGQLARALHDYESQRTQALHHSHQRSDANATSPAAKSTSKLREGVVKAVKSKAPKVEKDAVLIEGVGNLLVSMANCCKPLMGDPITGFITRGRGLSVHRIDCKDLKHLSDMDPTRVVDVQWGKSKHQRFRIEIQVQAFDRTGLLRDIGAVFADANVSILGASTKTDASEGTATMDYTLEVGDYEHLSTLLAKLRSLPNVFDARRI